MSLTSLLVVYLNWARRIIPARHRKVIIEPSLTADRRWKKLGSDVQRFLDKVRSGEDLMPHLSLRVKRNGYTPARLAAVEGGKWEDKDFLLIVMGYHHFHLGQQTQHNHTERTDDLLFAQVTRNEFHAMALFDHSVFNSGSKLSAEGQRMWELYRYRKSLGRPPGAYMAMGAVATSGHSLEDVDLARDYVRIIRIYDPKLDDLNARLGMFHNLPPEVVKAQKLSWAFNGQDLVLVDRKTNNFFTLGEGIA